MMLRRLLVTLVILLAVVVVTHAQSDDVADDRPEREIYTALGYGDAVFEPDLWRASAEEQATYTSALWRLIENTDTLVFLVYLHFDQGYTDAVLADYFSEQGFRRLLVHYEPWRQTAVCQMDDVTLYEFIGKSGGRRSLLRYWVQPISETRVLSVNAVFPDTLEDMLDDYSARLFPALPSCEAAGVG